jgi:pimeloyl-ACP methyl ester carboxylesterase
MNNSTPSRCLALFVHGFTGKDSTWDSLINLLEVDSRVEGSFELKTYPTYATGLWNLHPLRKYPSIADITKELATALRTSYGDYKKVTLIGHSQGGLIIQKCLLDFVEQSEWKELKRIEQVILIATPNLGSVFLRGLRNILFRKHPHEYALRVLNEEMSQVLRGISSKILAATKRGPDQWPVRIQCLWGNTDGIVSRASAVAVFDNANCHTVNADHMSIIKPKNRDDTVYKAFVNALLEPAGHRNFWEIEFLETKIEVRPRPATPHTFSAGKYKDKYKVESDNFATVTKSVKFSRTNRCDRSFVLDYLTHNPKGGVDEPYPLSFENDWSTKEQARYYETGRDYTYRFDPGPSTQNFKVDVYGGFDEGNRNINFNLGNEFYCKAFRFTLNLNKYDESGWKVNQEPTLYILGGDRKEKGEVLFSKHVEPARKDRCCWTWEMTDVHNEGDFVNGGWTTIMIHLSWDVCKPALPPQ